MTLTGLSEVAGLSKYHFHRLFKEFTGVSTIHYVRLLRLKRASYYLAFLPNIRIIDIAVEAGFNSAESFSRAFKKTFLQTPREFRNEPNWNNWNSQYQFKTKEERQSRQVVVCQSREVRLAVLTHRNDPLLANNTVKQFIEWRLKNKRFPHVCETYNILHNVSDAVKPEEYCIDIGCTIKKPVTVNNYGVKEKVIPAMRCAVMRHEGCWSGLESSVRYLEEVWLPYIGLSRGVHPCFVHLANLLPETAEHQLKADIYLPIE